MAAYALRDIFCHLLHFGRGIGWRYRQPHLAHTLQVGNIVAGIYHLIGFETIVAHPLLHYGQLHRCAQKHVGNAQPAKTHIYRLSVASC